MLIIYREFIDFIDLLPSVPPLEGNAGCFHPSAPPKVQFGDIHNMMIYAKSEFYYEYGRSLDSMYCAKKPNGASSNAHAI